MAFSNFDKIMPVINFSFKDLKGLMRKEIDFETLIDRLPMMGADVHQANPEDDELAFEFFPDRPDLYSVEGIARSMRAFLGLSGGLERYDITTSDVILKVDPLVDTVRPFIWGGLITGVEMNDYLIRSIMDIQEKLHLTVGRNRRKVAIGVHDFDNVNPPFQYTAMDPDEVSFFPLQGTREMTLREILEGHDKGKTYAFTLEGKDRYPVIFDRDDTVVSFPPIINGIATSVTEDTKNIFIECTGTDLNALKASVNILATAFAERGSKIGSIEIHRGEELLIAPDLEPWNIEVPIEQVRELTGISETSDELIHLLQRMGYDASASGDQLSVQVPAYRYDILHPADVIEDIAKAYGYERFGRNLPCQMTLGVPDPELDFWNVLRGSMVGLGYIEVTTLTLSGEEDQYIRMLRDRPENTVQVMNPRSIEHSILRTALIPEMMAILRKNKHRDLPQRIFEVGEVVIDRKNNGRIAGASIHPKACFTEMKSTIEALLRTIGIRLKIEPGDDPSFISGRCANIFVEDQSVGLLGEIDPEVITSFELGYPVAAFEISVSPIMEKSTTSWS